MEIMEYKSKIVHFFRKFKYVMLVLLIGIILMILPEKTSIDSAREDKTVSDDTLITPEARLEEILNNIDGAGKVQVFLSVASGEERIYQTDHDSSSSEESSNMQIRTVIISSNTDEVGLIRQINPPQYSGAIILCQGADKPQIQLAIVDAVSKVTGLGADKIAVLKMK